MRYDNMTPGIFLARPNRFIAHVQIDGQANRRIYPSGLRTDK